MITLLHACQISTSVDNFLSTMNRRVPCRSGTAQIRFREEGKRWQHKGLYGP
jgi:hypothetical protein